jgi:hypothetical protein
MSGQYRRKSDDGNDLWVIDPKVGKRADALTRYKQNGSCGIKTVIAALSAVIDSSFRDF